MKCNVFLCRRVALQRTRIVAEVARWRKVIDRPGIRVDY
jgi:hypothetical protein